MPDVLKAMSIVKQLYGHKYAEMVKPYSEMLAACMKQKNLDAIGAGMLLMKALPAGERFGSLAIPLLSSAIIEAFDNKTAEAPR